MQVMRNLQRRSSQAYNLGNQNDNLFRSHESEANDEYSMRYIPRAYILLVSSRNNKRTQHPTEKNKPIVYRFDFLLVLLRVFFLSSPPPLSPADASALRLVPAAMFFTLTTVERPFPIDRLFWTCASADDQSADASLMANLRYCTESLMSMEV